jgi:hypothetical protein
MDLMDSIFSESDSETDSDKILSINPPPGVGWVKSKSGKILAYLVKF